MTKRMFGMARVAALGGALALGMAAAPALAQDAPPAGTYDRTADAGDRGDWGWIGILGLAGLAGLLRRERPHHVPTTASATSRP